MGLLQLDEGGVYQLPDVAYVISHVARSLPSSVKDADVLDSGDATAYIDVLD